MPFPISIGWKPVFTIIVIVMFILLWMIDLSKGQSLTSDCGVNEEYRDCGPNCPMTCDNLDTNVCCDVKCVSGCFCRDGYIRNQNQCILLALCPKPGTLQFSARALQVPETVGVVRLQVTRTDGTKGPISIKYRTTSSVTLPTSSLTLADEPLDSATRISTAVADQDFMDLTGTLMMTDGQKEAFIDIKIIDDLVREPNEVFSLELFDPSNKVLIGTNKTTDIIIMDDDAKPGELNIDPVKLQVTENVGTVQLNIIRTGGTDGQVSVFYRTVDGSAQAGRDYTAAQGKVSFLEGESKKKISITIVDDSIREQQEGFTVQIHSPSGGARLGSKDIATIIISDNDAKPGELNIDPVKLQVTENVRTVQLDIKRTEGTDGQVSVFYATADGSAVAGRDYTAAQGKVSFLEGDSEKTISITILDDSIREQQEEFIIQIHSPSGGARLGSKNVATIIIIDNDEKPGFVSFQSSDMKVSENAGKVYPVVVRTGGTDGRITIHWSTVNNTALSGADFVGSHDGIVFEDGEAEKTLSIDIIDDNIFENNEMFQIKLYNPTGGAKLGTTPITQVMITDNDRKPGSFSFQNNIVRVPESIGKIELPVMRSGGTDGRVTVHWSTVNDTAQMDSDFIHTHAELVFEDGEAMKTISVTIIDDDLFEPNERFRVKLYNPGLEATLGDTVLTNVIIMDNDRQPGILQFRESQRRVLESVLIVRLTIVRVKGSDGTVKVRFTSLDGTATRNQDYRPVSGELEFPDGITEKIIEVEIIDDAIKEDDEQFTVQLFDPSGGAVIGPRKISTIVIEDNDAKHGIVEFQRREWTVLESSPRVSLTVVRKDGADGEVRVNWRTQDRSAISGQDYVESSGFFIFGDRITEKTLKVPILDDENEEPTENFIVQLFNPQGGVAIGPVDKAVIKIQDNDDRPSVIQFRRRRGSVRENAGSIRVPVVRSGNLKNLVTVRWMTVERSATHNTDFIGGQGSITFDPNERQKFIEIGIVNDPNQETNELFDVVLFQPSEKAILGTLSKYTVEILDDDEDPLKFSFQNTRLIVNEGNARVRLVVIKTGPSKSGTVRYKTVDATAIGGKHYGSAEGELRFTDDQTDNLFFIEIFEDSVTNPPRTFQVELHSPSDGGVIEDGKAVVTIEDNDIEPIVQKDVDFPSFSSPSSPPPLPSPTTIISFRPPDVFTGCPPGLILKECARSCPESCESVRRGTSCNRNVQRFQCIRGCFCPQGLVLATGSINTCIRPSDCGRSFISGDASSVIPAPKPGGISFRDINISVKESDGFVLLKILRSSLLGVLTIFWRTTDVTAILNVHYRVAFRINQLVLSPGDLESILRIEIINDNEPNPPRTFKVELFSPFNQNLFVPGLSTCTVTILDDDGPVQNDASVQAPSGGISIPNADQASALQGLPIMQAVPALQPGGISFRDINITVKEGDGFVLLNILRSSLLGILTIFWRTTDVTAILNVHYRVASRINQLVLSPGDLESILRIEIINDEVPNPPRTFKVELFSPFNQNLFVPGLSTCTVTIVDDDGPVQSDASVQAPPRETSIPVAAQASAPQGLSGIQGCPPTMIQTSCKSPCELSCAQLVCPRQHTLLSSMFGLSTNCSPGCGCPEGTVLDRPGGNRCVRRSSCTLTIPSL